MAIKINGNTVIDDSQNFTSTGTLSATGNITGGNVLTGGLVSATGNVTAANFATSGTISATGNITAGNIIANVVSTGPVSTTGNVTGGNILTGGLVSATGNITGNFFIGNGSQLTGIDATAIQNGTANVRTFLNGNVTTSAGGTANVLNVTSTGVIVTGTESVTGTITGGNVATGGTVSATGNITGGNVTGTNLTGSLTTAAQANITSVGTLTSLNSGAISSSGNVTGANLLTGGLISATGNITGGNIIGTIVGNVSTATVSASGNITGANLLTAGILSATGNVFGGNALFSGNLTVNGNVTYINSNVVTINDLAINLANNAANVSQTNNGGLELGPQGSPFVTFLYNSSANTWVSSAGLSATANVVGGNITTGGIISATGNVTGGNILAAGIMSSTGNGIHGNVLTAGLISATGAITTASNLSLTGNIVDTGALFINTGSNGNITLNPNGTGVVILNKDLLNGQANGTGNIGNSTGYFNTIFAKATSAQYADLAEKYTADADYEPGTVVMFGGAQEVTLCVNDACRRVAGVISTNPSYRMNDGLVSAHTAMVALTGRVPCRVTGTVRKGDLMVSAGNGSARAEADPAVGTVIGKALADHDGDTGTIEVVVGRV